MIKRRYKYMAVFFVVVFQLLLLTGCTFSNTGQKSDMDSGNRQEESLSSNIGDDTVKVEDVMRIKVSSENAEVIFELNESSASKSFYEQLPLTVSVENYSTNEKIFELPQKLDISNVWEGRCPKGSIAYFSPWNNVAMYYGDAPEYKGLYPMGTAVEGIEKIGELTGNLTITAYTEDTISAKKGKAPTVILNSGYEIPVLGLGTYSLLNEECVDSVYTAIKSGYRLIDTAYMYHNDVICCEV